MAGGKRGLVWASAVVGGLAIAGLGVYFVVVGLDRADKLASVIGVFATLIGLGLSASGAVLTRHGAAPRPNQTVADSTVGGEALQVRDIRGSLRVGGAGAGSPSTPPSTPTISTRSLAPPAGQSILGTQTVGPARQIDGVGGDAEIDR